MTKDKDELPLQKSGQEVPKLVEKITDVREVVPVGFSEMVADYFGVDRARAESALTKATECILRAANSEQERDVLRGFIEAAVRRLPKLQKNRANEYVHGTGTDAFYGILMSGGIIRRGSEFGGADVEMGHTLAETEAGERETYISLSDNQPMGYALSYFYARGFMGPETRQNLALDANRVNGSNVVLEQWDALSQVERDRLRSEYGFSREKLASASERPHSFNPSVERNKVFVYQTVLERLRDGKIDGPDVDMPPGGEIHQLVGKRANVELVNILLKKIRLEQQKYPDMNVEEKIVEYEGLLHRTMQRLDAFDALSPEEQRRKVEQNPVIFIIDKDRVASAQRTVTVAGQERPIHPSGQEVRAYADIGLDAITEIQAPAKILSEIKGAIGDRDIRLVPLELYEVERVIAKNVYEQ